MEDDDDEEEEDRNGREKKRVSLVRVKRKRGTEPSADVLFLVGEEGEMRDDDDDERAKKRRRRSSGKQTQKGRDGTKRDQELAAQLDAVLGGGSQALPSYRQNQMERQQQETKTKTGDAARATRKNVLRKFVRLTREAVEQKDARDAEKVKTLLENRREGGGEGGGGGGAGGASSSRVEEGSTAAAAKKNRLSSR